MKPKAFDKVDFEDQIRRDTSRRSLLGAAGAAALLNLLPWRPKPKDIVVASPADVPLYTNPPEAKFCRTCGQPAKRDATTLRCGEAFEYQGIKWIATDSHIECGQDMHEMAFVGSAFTEYVGGAKWARLALNAVSTGDATAVWK